jgi:lipopolysaccharide transport system permease protein
MAVELNPMYHIVLSFQGVMLYGERPHVEGLIAVGVFGLVMLGVSLLMFRRAAPEMVDVL